MRLPLNFMTPRTRWMDWMRATLAAGLLLALAAYTSYVINAAQFLLKLRAARLDGAAA